MKADQSTDLSGWLPVDAVVVDGRPGLWWMEMSGVSLAEPFFQQTVERARERIETSDSQNSMFYCNSRSRLKVSNLRGSFFTPRVAARRLSLMRVAQSPARSFFQKQTR